MDLLKRVVVSLLYLGIFIVSLILIGQVYSPIITNTQMIGIMLFLWVVGVVTIRSE